MEGRWWRVYYWNEVSEVPRREVDACRLPLVWIGIVVPHGQAVERRKRDNQLELGGLEYVKLQPPAQRVEQRKGCLVLGWD
jgi:hypothetical protein